MEEDWSLFTMWRWLVFYVAALSTGHSRIFNLMTGIPPLCAGLRVRSRCFFSWLFLPKPTYKILGVGITYRNEGGEGSSSEQLFCRRLRL